MTRTTTTILKRLFRVCVCRWELGATWLQRCWKEPLISSETPSWGLICTLQDLCFGNWRPAALLPTVTRAHTRIKIHVLALQPNADCLWISCLLHGTWSHWLALHTPKSACARTRLTDCVCVFRSGGWVCLAVWGGGGAASLVRGHAGSRRTQETQTRVKRILAETRGKMRTH